MLLALIALVLFGCAALVGIVTAALMTREVELLPDSPAPRPVHPLWPLAAMLGLAIVLCLRHATAAQLGFVALAGIPLVAAWYSDAKTGLIPDWFTLAPLAVVAGYVVMSHHWFSAYSACVIFIPFAITALLSRGVGMGWGDVKLATFCGTMIGVMAALPAFSAACLAATAVSYARDRGKRPVAFGPYIVGSTFVALAFVV
ncbi:MAG: A24 family peptidase [Candidatus Eremiobacteraeota bacterium]|nr:A24 family peptidase [Candidatus Eremiobacteraeota bacterium]